jgi:hypothetical protein
MKRSHKNTTPATNLTIDGMDGWINNRFQERIILCVDFQMMR